MTNQSVAGRPECATRRSCI